jgi:nitroreductase
VITDAEERKRLRVVTQGQKFIEEAPVVFVCCADLEAYSQPSRQQRMQEFIEYGVLQELGITQGVVEEQYRARRSQVTYALTDAYQSGRFNVAIAVQNMVLMATALGLGSCWIGAMDGEAIHDMYQLPDNLRVVVLLTVGYPALEPPPRPRLPLAKIVLKPLAKQE